MVFHYYGSNNQQQIENVLYDMVPRLPVFVSWKYNYNILLQHKTTKNLLFWHFETVVLFILRTFELQLGHNEIVKTEMVQLFFAGDTA